MRIIVCLKQVPDSQKVKVNPETGVLMRGGVDSIMNPFDLYALETALRIKEKLGGEVFAISMGPPNAKEVLTEAFSMGADEGYLLSDRKFGGADVLATSYTLAQGIEAIDCYDLIICGKQTTDGDTAQTGPAISEYLNIPVVPWVKEIVDVNESVITVKQDMNDYQATVTMNFPCVLTIEKDIFQPRLPSYRKQQDSKNKEIHVLTFNDMPVKNEKKYGLSGSATKVERIFEPTSDVKSERYEGEAKEVADKLYNKLLSLRFVEGK